MQALAQRTKQLEAELGSLAEAVVGLAAASPVPSKSEDRSNRAGGMLETALRGTALVLQWATPADSAKLLACILESAAAGRYSSTAVACLTCLN